jgi:hypothetical protein
MFVGNQEKCIFDGPNGQHGTLGVEGSHIAIALLLQSFYQNRDPLSLLFHHFSMNNNDLIILPRPKILEKPFKQGYINYY